MTLLEQLKIRTGRTDGGADELLCQLIGGAEDFICSYCSLEKYDESLDSLCLRMAAEDYSRIASEGIEYRSFSGMYESYRSGYSDSVMAMLRACRKLRAV